MPAVKSAVMPKLRRQLLGKVHLLAKQSGLDEDAYRDLLERETGSRSAATLSEPQIVRVIEKLGAPRKAKLAGKFAPKLKALWISGWHLGLVRDNTDEAMLAFVKRQTGFETTRFLIDAKDANRAIEGLKAWLERQGDVRWWEHPKAPRVAVAEAQVRALDAAGDIIDLGFAGRNFLENYACRVSGKNRGLAFLDDQDWDRVIAALGARLRKARGRNSAQGT